MSKTKKVLQALVVLAFLTGLTALTIAEVIPNPDDIAFKLTQTKSKSETIIAQPDARENPFQYDVQTSFTFRDQYLSEGFEGGVMPPTGWTLDQFNPVETWGVDTYNPFEGSYYATCLYDDTYTDVQNEWMITPDLDLATATSDVKLEFAWQMSYYWGVDPYDNYDLIVKVSDDGGSTWTDLWTEQSEGVFDSWVWYEKTIGLSAYIGDTIQLAFVYDGYDGAQGSFDGIDVNDDPLPIGRCCYGDPTAPDCDDVTEIDCDALGGDWNAALNCTDDPCPVAGPNDECTGALEMVDGDDVTGTTAGATVDCPGVLDWNAVWYYFDNPYANADVVFDYCNVPIVENLESLGVVLYDECPADCPNYILYSENEWVACPPAPSTQPITYFNRLPGPATYYYPVFIGDADVNPIESPFAFNFSIAESAPIPPGGSCDDPVTVNIPADVDYTDVNTTCGKVDVYGAGTTCLGPYYDGGEDIIYELVVTATTDVDILLDPDQTYSGILLDDACPPDPTTCLYSATAGYSTTEYGFYSVTLDPGTYYIMIDTWPAPDCVDFTLNIREAEEAGPGNDCSDPVIVKLPADLPYADIAQKTCTRVDDYENTCLGYYDGGDDIIYQLDVTDPLAAVITLDPKGTSWTGIGIGDACPLGDPCLDFVTGSSGTTLKVIEIVLDPGTYYIMVDTWPSPQCIPDFDLTIELGPSLSFDPTSFDFGTVNVGDNGGDVLEIENVGGGILQWDLDVSYAPPREIDGAFIAALGDYSPGATMDIDFILQNASSDAEWLDECTITFPAGVNVVNSTNFEVTPTKYLEYDGTTGDGVTVTWFDHNGSYGNVYSSEAAFAAITLSFDAGLSGPLTINYTISGDDWGSPPHDISGSTTIDMADPLTSWLNVTPGSGSTPGGVTNAVDVLWDATGLINDTYNADIVITHNAKNTDEVPVTLTVTGGDSKAKLLPELMYIYYKYAFDAMTGTAYVGNFNAPYTAADVAAVTIEGVAGTIVGTTTHPAFSGDAVEVEFSLAPFLEVWGAPIDTVKLPFAVVGEFSDASTFDAQGRVELIGKSSASGGKRWILPPDQVVLPGDANIDGAHDVDDVVAMIGIIFQGGDVFGQLMISDVNCSHSVDVDDVVYMIGYVFQGGDTPCYETVGE